MPVMNLKNDWSYHSVERMWSFGYESSQLERLFNSIPHELSCLMKRGLKSLHIIHQMRPTKKNSGTLLSNDEWCSDDLELMRSEAETWDRDNMQGFLQVSYDPNTNQRTHIVINSRYAHLHGYHKEEMLARFGSRDLDVQRTDIDWLALWLDNFQVRQYQLSQGQIACNSVFHERADRYLERNPKARADRAPPHDAPQGVFDERSTAPSVRHFRVLPPRGGGGGGILSGGGGCGGGGGVLLRTSTVKSFNSLGQATKARLARAHDRVLNRGGLQRARTTVATAATVARDPSRRGRGRTPPEPVARGL